MTTPKSQLQEVLYEIYTEGKINRMSAMEYYGIYNLPSLIHKLRQRHNVPIITEEVKLLNKFGRKISYCNYTILGVNKEVLRDVYPKVAG